LERHSIILLEVKFKHLNISLRGARSRLTSILITSSTISQLWRRMTGVVSPSFSIHSLSDRVTSIRSGNSKSDQNHLCSIMTLPPIKLLEEKDPNWLATLHSTQFIIVQNFISSRLTVQFHFMEIIRKHLHPSV
jgi:site-specific recombinase